VERTEAENAAERRALERAGFIHEGTLRKAVFRDGDWRDTPDAG
jgi:RimJ/RimL family protein N-acetyltransferase